MITSLLAGYLIDRIGARRLVLWSVPCFGLGLASLALFHADILIFHLGLALVSLAGVGCWPVAYNKATALWFDRRLGFSLGLANTGISTGAALLPPLQHQAEGHDIRGGNRHEVMPDMLSHRFEDAWHRTRAPLREPGEVDIPVLSIGVWGRPTCICAATSSATKRSAGRRS